jgi:hypothetical protein
VANHNFVLYTLQLSVHGLLPRRGIVGHCVDTNTIRAYDTIPARGSKSVTTRSADEDTVTTVGAKAGATGSTLSTQRATGRSSYADAARRALKLPARMA